MPTRNAVLQYGAEDSAKIKALRNATSQGIMQLESGLYDEIGSEDLEQYLEELSQQAGEKH